jgi:hypothetical protein
MNLTMLLGRQMIDNMYRTVDSNRKPASRRIEKCNCSRRSIKPLRISSQPLSKSCFFDRDLEMIDRLQVVSDS